MSGGWIKLHRCIDEWEWRSSPDMLSVWLYLLTNARHEAGRWKGIDLDAGQLVIGRKAVSRKIGVSEQSIRTAITRLKSTNTITTKTTNRYTIVTIVNWELYQQADEKATSKATNKTTSKQPASNQQTTTNKNEKKERITPYTPLSPKGGEIIPLDDRWWYGREKATGRESYVQTLMDYCGKHGESARTLFEGGAERDIPLGAMRDAIDVSCIIDGTLTHVPALAVAFADGKKDELKENELRCLDEFLKGVNE